MAPDIVCHIILTFRLHKEDGKYVARCEELGISSCAKTIDKAMTRIEEATLLYLTTLEDVGERQRVFEEAGIEVIAGEPFPHDIDIHTRSNEVVTSRSARLPDLAFC